MTKKKGQGFALNYYITMKALLSRLIFFSRLSVDPVLMGLSEALEALSEPDYDYEMENEDGTVDRYDRDDIRQDLHVTLHEILRLSADYGFEGDLYASYIAYLIAADENPLSLLSEGLGIPEGSASLLSLQDCSALYELLHYDLSPLDQFLGSTSFSLLRNYQSAGKRTVHSLREASLTISELERSLMRAGNPLGIQRAISEFYRRFGSGSFALHRAFRIEGTEKERELVPIKALEPVDFDSLLGYEAQKKLLCENTEAFLRGRPCNNVLLYGDAGTGKSTMIRALLHHFQERGLRLIEVYKQQLRELPWLNEILRNRNYRFILFLDDLSFEESETEYKYLKSLIEGGIEARPDNILIYATSNRRHLVREFLSDRKDMVDQEELHHSDTMEEKLSLSDRFGLNILFQEPSFEDYQRIVLLLAGQEGLKMEREELLQKARAWSVQRGGRTGRTARQFIHSLG